MARLKSVADALADLKRNGGIKVIAPPRMDSITCTFMGYHQFINPLGEPYGMFEVFHHDGETKDWIGVSSMPGYYWWACMPGCMPDSDPNGPFPTAEGAYLDAIGD